MPNLVPTYYDVRHCPDKKHHCEVSNISYVMDESGAFYANGNMFLLKGIKRLSKVLRLGEERQRSTEVAALHVRASPRSVYQYSWA